LIKSSGGIELLLQANDTSGSILIKLSFRSKLDIDVFAFLLIDVLLFDATAAAATAVVVDSKDDVSFLRDSFDDDDDLSESSDS
jgi:hypothetical protein